MKCMKECERHITIIVNAEPFITKKAGVGTVAYEVTKKLINQPKYNLKVILFSSQRLEEFSNTSQIIIPNITKVPGFSSFRLFILFPILCYLNKADVFIEFTHFGPFNLHKKTKRVTYIHDLTPLTHPHFHTFSGSLLQKIFLRRILRKTDLIITNSQHTKKDLTQIFPFTKDKSKINYLGVSEIYFPNYGYDAIIKNCISKPYFLFVGTIEPRKNLEILLKAFEKLNSQESLRYNLVIVGKIGWKFKNTLQKIKNHIFYSDIIMTKYVTNEDLNQLYTHAIALVYPSIYEGFGLPIAEAYRCNTISIVSRNSSLIEIGEICRSIFFETNDKDSLLDAIYKSLNRNSHIESKMQYFSWNKHTNKLLEYICTLK